MFSMLYNSLPKV